MKGVNLSNYVKKTATLDCKDYNLLSLLKIILFAFAYDVGSTRKITYLCRIDIRFTWLTKGCYPSYTTIATFIKYRLTNSNKDIFLELNNYYLTNDDVNTIILYIDGTKFEVNANKYTFVWKRAILKFKDKLYLKISNEITNLNNYLEYTVYVLNDETIDKQLLLIINYINLLIENDGVTFVYGKGTKKHYYQRFLKDLLVTLKNF